MPALSTGPGISSQIPGLRLVPHIRLCHLLHIKGQFGIVFLYFCIFVFYISYAWSDILLYHLRDCIFEVLVFFIQFFVFLYLCIFAVLYFCISVSMYFHAWSPYSATYCSFVTFLIRIIGDCCSFILSFRQITHFRTLKSNLGEYMK